MHFNHPEKSALVDLVMKDASDEERLEATRNWFNYLEALIRIVEEDERKKARDKIAA